MKNIDYFCCCYGELAEYSGRSNLRGGSRLAHQGVGA